MGLHEWDENTYGPGLYYWRGMAMKGEHFIIVQLSEYKNKDIAPGRLHAEMLIPCSGAYYPYKFHGPIENMPNGEWLGPIESPGKMTY